MENLEAGAANLIINYLPQSLTDEEFHSMFAAIGTLKSTKVIREKSSGYSYGFGFVEYEKMEDAEKAIKELNGLQVQNKKIKVAFSRNHNEAKGGNLYIRNLPREMNQDQLKEMFQACGSVVNCRILTDSFTGLSKGVGFVLFDKKSEADEAIKKFNNATPPNGTEPLNVKHAEDNAGKGKTPNVMAFNSMGAGGPMRTQTQNRNRFNPMGNTRPAWPHVDGFTLFVYNIGTDADENSVWQLFSPFGHILKVDIIRDYARNNQCKGFCFVSMRNYHEAANAVNGLNGYRYKQQPLQVSFKK